MAEQKKSGEGGGGENLDLTRQREADQQKEQEMRKKIDQLAKQTPELEQQLGKLAWYEMSLQQAFAAKGEQIADLEAESARLNELEAYVRRSREESTGYERTLHEYKQRNHDFEKAVAREVTYETELSRKLVLMHKSNHETHEAIAEAERTSAQLKKQLEDVQKHNASLRHEIVNVQKEIVTSQQILAATRQELGIIESQVSSEIGRRKEPLGVPVPKSAKNPSAPPPPTFRLLCNVKNQGGTPAGGEPVSILSAASGRIIGSATANADGQIDTPVAEQDVIVVMGGERFPVKAELVTKAAAA